MKMAVEFGTGKTICILAIVAGCFAVLWPKLFYPMLQASITTRNPIDNSQGHHRQERPPHLHPDMLHPALRERGRAIPQSHVVPRVVEKEGRPGPVPGMRPPMGGAGHVVPAPKGSGTMGILMPIYTIGIVVFFMYTVMKVMFKKPGQSAVNYSDFNSDPEFRKIVFSEEYVDDQTNSYGDQIRQKVKHETSTVWKTTEENGTKLGWKERDTIVTAISGLLAEVDLQREILAKRAEEQNHSERKGEDALYEKRNEMAHTAQEEVHNLQNSSSPSDTTQKVDDSSEHDHHDGGKPKVQVMGMEMTASCEGGQRWSRPSTPILAVPSHSRSGTPIPPPTPEPQSIYLEGALPSQSQLLVSESETQAVAVDPEDLGSDTDAPIVLSGKMTLSLISLDAALAAEDEHFSCKEPVLDTILNEKQKLQELKSALRDETAPDAPTTSEEEKEEEEVEEDEVQGDRIAGFQHMNDMGHVDDAPTTTNYTTASTAAEATGSEETAADYSALDSFGPSDDQQEELEDDDEEVWNGDVGSAEDESEEEAAQAQAAPQNMQRQQR